MIILIICITLFIVVQWQAALDKREARSAEEKGKELELAKFKSSHEAFTALGIKIVGQQRPDSPAAIEILAFESRFDCEKQLNRVAGQAAFELSGVFFILSRNPALTEIPVVTDYLNHRKNLFFRVNESSESKAITARAKQFQEAEVKRIIYNRSKNVFRRTREDTGNAAVGVYCMQSSLGIKVGISSNPESRLAQVQTGHPHIITLQKVVWLKKRTDAELVERAAHDYLRQKGRGMHGEWFDNTLDEVLECLKNCITELITSGKIESKFSFVDSEKIARSEEDEDILLLLTGWAESKKGNYYRTLGSSRLTAYKRRRGWSFFCDNQKSSSTYPSSDAAKIGAILHYRVFVEKPTTCSF